MSHTDGTYDSYRVNDFQNSSIFIKVQWAEWHAMHSLVNFNDFLWFFCLQNKTCICNHLRIYDRIYSTITFLKWFFEFVKQLWFSITFPSLFLVSTMWENVTILWPYCNSWFLRTSICGRAPVGIRAWTVLFENIQPKMESRNHKIRKISSATRITDFSKFLAGLSKILRVLSPTYLDFKALIPYQIYG